MSKPAAAAGSSFLPTDVAGIVAWFDASDASSFSYHSGVVVSQWSDLSGNGNHLTSAASGSAPSRNGTQNSLSTVVFDGTDDRLVAAGVDSALSGSVDFTIVAVYHPGTVANSFAFGTHTTSSGRGVAPLRSASNQLQLRLYNASTSATRTATVSVDTYRTLVVTGDASGTPYIATFRVDGTQGGSWTESTSAAQASAAGGFALGSRSATGTGYASARFAEFIVYDNIISAGDITDLETYLSAKWATF